MGEGGVGVDDREIRATEAFSGAFGERTLQQIMENHSLRLY